MVVNASDYILINMGLFTSAVTQARQKTTVLHEQGLSPNYFTQNRCVNYNKSEFATKQHKMCLKTTMSKIEPLHNYRGNIYVIHFLFSILKVKIKSLLSKSFKYHPKKRRIAT